MKVLILEDQTFDYLKIEEIVRNTLPEAEILWKKTLPDEFHEQFDLLLADIYLSQTLSFPSEAVEDRQDDGITLVRKHRDLFSAVVFISRAESRMQDAFGPSVFGFVTKDQLQTDLPVKLLEAATWLAEKKKPRVKGTSPLNGRKYWIGVNDILCFLKRNRKIYFRTSSGMVLRSSFRSISQTLEFLEQGGCRFWQINQSDLINPEYLLSVRSNRVYLSDETCLDIGKTFRKEFSEKWMASG